MIKNGSTEFGKNMYILFVTMSYPRTKYLTSGIFEFDQAKALIKEGIKVVYLSLDLRSIRKWRKFGIDRIKKNGINIYSFNFPLGNFSSSIYNFISSIGFYYSYKKILKNEGKPDILHAHFFKPAYIAAKYVKKINIPLIITEHSSLINTTEINKTYHKMALFAYNKAQKVISVSEALSKNIETNFNIKSMVIPNIFNSNIFKYASKIKSNHFQIVSTGNLIYSKRMDLTISAFVKAFQDNNNVKLIIFGDGPERIKLQQMIHDLNAEKKIELKGICIREEIASYLNESDLFVLASQTETFGVSYIEALAMGVPVIATKCGGPEGFIDNQNGILVDIDNFDQLVDSFHYMYENIGKYDRELISNRSNKLFSEHTVAKKLIELYNQVLNA